MNLVDVAISILCLGAGSFAWLRWLRVAQREHYLPGAATQFALRWWNDRPANQMLGILAVCTAIASFWLPVIGILAAAIVAIGPLGLGVRGRTSPLNWTRRLRTLAILSGVVSVVLVIIAVLLGIGPLGAAIVVLFVPIIVDVADVILRPLEKRSSEHFIESATDRILRIQPDIVGITGSYGKTSTKEHLAALLSGDRAVVPSPRSFNNRAGLARAINEHLSEGTEIFIAEMGTYGKGEIQELVSWCPPEIAVITAIGPVHLERFGSLDVTLSAKAEILAPASVAVLNVDDERLAELAERLDTTSTRIVRVGSHSREADVVVAVQGSEWNIEIAGETIGIVQAPRGLQPTNVACALGAALALGVDRRVLSQRVATLPSVEHRLTSTIAPSGVLVLDDTFNSNPAGAAAALEALEHAPITGRRVVVTPGMIELGNLQRSENQKLGSRAAAVADVLIIVGRTNARSLGLGAHEHSSCEIRRVRTREEAVAWVRTSLGDGDGVLYENDLPDHYS